MKDFSYTVKGILFSQATRILRYPDVWEKTSMRDIDAVSRLLADKPRRVGVTFESGNPKVKTREFACMCGLLDDGSSGIEYIIETCSHEMYDELLEMGCQVFAYVERDRNMDSTGIAASLPVRFVGNMVSVDDDAMTPGLSRALRDAALVSAVLGHGFVPEETVYEDVSPATFSRLVSNVTLGQVETSPAEGWDSLPMKAMLWSVKAFSPHWLASSESTAREFLYTLKCADIWEGLIDRHGAGFVSQSLPKLPLDDVMGLGEGIGAVKAIRAMEGGVEVADILA